MKNVAEYLGFNTESFRKVFHNFSWLMTDQVLRIVFGFVISIYFVRNFSVEIYGAYNYSLALVTFIVALSGLGLEQIVVKELVAKPTNEGKIIGTAVFLRTITSLITTLLLLIVVSYLRPGDSLIHRLVFALSLSSVFQSFYVFDFWFQSRLLSKYSVIAKDIAFLTTSLIKIYLLFKGLPIIYFGYLFSFEFLLAALGQFLFFKSIRPGVSFELDRLLGKQMLGYSWPLILSGVAVFMYMKLNQILLGNMLGDREVGIYSLAVMFSEFWYFVPVSLCSSVFPSLVRYRKYDVTLYEKRVKQFVKHLMILSIVMGFLVMFFGKTLIVTVYGIKYAESANVLTILIWSGIAVSMGLVSNQILIIDNLTKLALARSLIGAGTNILLGIFLIPRFGIYGAAWSAMLGYFSSTYSVFLFKNGRSKNLVLLNFLKDNRYYR